MLAYLKGKLSELEKEKAIIESHGLGFEIKISLQTYNHLQNCLDQEVKIITHLIVREEGPELFGFLNSQEKDLFLMLTRVSSVGPKTAINIFSALSLQDLVKAIVGNQPKILSSAPGVGLKTGQRIILELKEKLIKLKLAESSSESETQLDLPPNWLEEIELTLFALGYSPDEVQSVLLDQVDLLKQQAHVDDAIRQVLSCLDQKNN